MEIRNERKKGERGDEREGEGTVGQEKEKDIDKRNIIIHNKGYDGGGDKGWPGRGTTLSIFIIDKQC